MSQFEHRSKFVKFDESLGLVFGFAIVSKIKDEPYFDVQGDHIPEDAMLKASTDFMLHSREAHDMHNGTKDGDVVFAFPLTTEIAKSLNIQTEQTGLLIAMKPSAETLAKYKSGDYTGFSIGGRRVTDEVVPE